ncbi:MAG: hypothetical protein QOK15_334 [Nocardioidaceae bacterium]|nr:hypothetical protein [Nocardioidaceae bacterium]
MGLVTDLTDRRLTALLAAEQHTGRLPSLVCAMTRDGSLVWRGSRGDATGDAQGLAFELQYRIGSITKTMTAVLVLQLRDERRLSLNDRLSDHLPETDLPGLTRLTLRNLLSHSSGLTNEPPGEWWERVEGGSFAELVAKLAEAGVPFDAGTTHHYSNLGYGLLGEVVARVSGRPWWECLTERLLGPLGMRRTSYDPFDPHAQGYSVHPYSPLLSVEPATDTGAMAPAGQVWSTVTDLAAYADFLIAGHRDVLSPDTLAEMGVPQAGQAGAGLGDGYGLGLRLVPGGSGTLIGHTGSMPGFQAALFVDRPRRTGVVLLANAIAGLDTVGAPRRLLEELEAWEPDVPRAWAPVDAVPPEVEELLGVWHWGNTAKVFTWDGAELRCVDASTGEREETFRRDDQGFVGEAGYHAGERLEVARRADGSVSHLVCSTFVFTRVPYDPAAPIPGGPPPSS